MDSKMRLGLEVLVVSLLNGLTADLLLREIPWGANIFLWVAGFGGSLLFLSYRWHHEKRIVDHWLVLMAVGFSAACVWRDSPTLRGLNLLVTAIAVGLLARPQLIAHLRQAGVIEYGLNLGLAWLSPMIGPTFAFSSEMEWKQIPRSKWTTQASAILRGAVIAFPLLLVFGGLLVSADATFERLVNHFFNFDPAEIFVHAGLILIGAWLVGGLIQRMFIDNGPGLQPSTLLPLGLRNLGITEVATVLSLLNLLFLSFVLIQIRYFFGGAARVFTTSGLTFAEYARRGFFELVTVAALVLPVLLALHWMLNQENPAHERLFRWLAGFQVVMLMVMMTSALQRMMIYQKMYGLTELRVYTTAFMLWLAIVFVWFGMTVLRGQRQTFAFGALVTGILAVGILNVVNPDALIAQTNLTRVSEGRTVDASYLTRLSADAVPIVVDHLETIHLSQRVKVADWLITRWTPDENITWRSWNLSRSKAWQKVYDRKTELCSLACQPVE